MGLTLVPDYEADSFAFWRHLKKLLDACRVTCILDVGANLGQYRDDVVSKAGWTGPVVSFEPVERYFDSISRRGSDSWKAFNFALGCKEGVDEITVFDSVGLASLKRADIPAMNKLLPKHAVNAIAQEKIDIRRLDQVFADVTRGIDASRVLLKIDTQGYDLEVLRGAEGILDRVCVLQSELSFIPIYRDAPDFLESLNEIRTRGFSVSGMFPLALDESCRAIEMDCLFVAGEHPGR